MSETPNENDPQADVVFIVEELLSLFNEAAGENDQMRLNSGIGSRFHARVLNAAKHLGLIDPDQTGPTSCPPA